MNHTIIELRDGAQSRLCLLQEYHAETTDWSIVFANGTTATMSVVTCEIRGDDDMEAGRVSWRVIENQKCYGTDALIDWEAHDLAEIRTSWGDGECFPPISDAKTILLALQESAVFTTNEEGIKNTAHLGTVCEWLQSPTKDKMALAHIACDNLLPFFMQGSLIRDAMQVIKSIENSRDLAKLVRSEGHVRFADLV